MLPATLASSPMIIIESLYSMRNDDAARIKPIEGKISLTWCRQQATIVSDEVAEPAIPIFSEPAIFPVVIFLWYLKSPICTPTARGIRYTKIPLVRNTWYPFSKDPSAREAIEILKRTTSIPALAPKTKGFFNRFLMSCFIDILFTISGLFLSLLQRPG